MGGHEEDTIVKCFVFEEILGFIVKAISKQEGRLEHR